jgi:hypothetical protein
MRFIGPISATSGAPATDWYGHCERLVCVADARHRGTESNRLMKTIVTAFSIAALASLPLAAQVEQTTEKTEVTENPDGSVTEKKTVITKSFNPEVQTRVVKYFDPYKGEMYGLPPELVKTVQIKRVPKTWRTTRIAPGIVVKEEERPYLIAAPPKLVEILPQVESAKVRYYVAGGNVVAVDENYRVVDSVQIPSVKIVVDE